MLFCLKPFLETINNEGLLEYRSGNFCITLVSSLYSKWVKEGEIFWTLTIFDDSEAVLSLGSGSSKSFSEAFENAKMKLNKILCACFDQVN